MPLANIYMTEQWQFPDKVQSLQQQVGVGVKLVLLTQISPLCDAVMSIIRCSRSVSSSCSTSGTRRVTLRYKHLNDH